MSKFLKYIRKISRRIVKKMRKDEIFMFNIVERRSAINSVCEVRLLFIYFDVYVAYSVL